MDYKSVLEFLYNQLPMYQRVGGAAYKSDLTTTIALDNYFNHPHKSFKSVHIAGTNGKGSVSHSLAAILQSEGYKTGLYTSPHLCDFRERIRINGKMISEEKVCEFVNENKSILEDLKPSFFEMTVAMAFHYFANEGIDIAVIETGMGGRLDSTNILSPLLSVITNISLEHTKFLGDTEMKIAAEKGGIIKSGIPVVIGRTQDSTKSIFIEKAKLSNSEILFADSEYKYYYSTKTAAGNQSIYLERTSSREKFNYEIDLLGSYQAENICTVLSVCEVLIRNGLNISERSIRSGLKNIRKLTALRGRWEVLGANPLIVCDTGHNADALAVLVKQIEDTAFHKLHMIFGMVSDKNAVEVLNLLPKNASYYFVEAKVPRSMKLDVLTQYAKEADIKGFSIGNISEAVKLATKNASSHDMIFIGGSTFVVAEALEYFDLC